MPKPSRADDDVQSIAGNKRAFHDYFIEEKFEAGLSLLGTEIKSIRAGGVSIKESYVKIEGGEAWLINATINPYENARLQHDPSRKRKLLLKRREIDKLERGVEQKGCAIVPLRLYIRNRRAKIEIALGRGKAKYDKRQTIRERETQRELRGLMKERGAKG